MLETQKTTQTSALSKLLIFLRLKEKPVLSNDSDNVEGPRCHICGKPTIEGLKEPQRISYKTAILLLPLEYCLCLLKVNHFDVNYRSKSHLKSQQQIEAECGKSFGKLPSEL